MGYDTKLWTWDPEKDRLNRDKHGLSFETAIAVFADPLAITTDDPYLHEERYRTIGRIDPVTVLVVHTDPLREAGAIVAKGRIISARKATRHEREKYENDQFF